MITSLRGNNWSKPLPSLGKSLMTLGAIDMAIYGGSCLMLVSNFRFASADVDAVASEDQRFIDHAAQTIAARRGWPRDWLNDGVRTFLSPRVERLEQHELFRTYPSEQTPGMRAFVPAPEYMLAMKLMALRLDAASGQKDLEDILNLMQVAGIKEKGDIVRLASGFYPEARREREAGARHRLLVERT